MQLTEQGLLSGQRGTKQVVRIPVTEDLGGMNVELVVHVLTGKEPGPVLSLLSCLHGSEWQSIEILRRVVDAIDPDQLTGTLLALPVGNPVSLCYNTRNVPDESDSADVNRAFTNKNTWLADLLAGTISRELLDRSDAMIDYHIMPWGAAEASTSYPGDLPSPDDVERNWRMALSFGAPCTIRRTLTEFPGTKSSYGYATRVLNIPNIGVSLGGLGWDHATEQDWINTNVRGTLNVMKHMGMLAGEPELPDRILAFQRGHRVNPRTGGILIPAREPDKLMRPVAKDELLGTVISAGTFEVLEELRSPCNGYLWGMARSYPVRPGYWCFLVINGDEDTTRWVDPRQECLS